jgi:outer membrane protein assembly factor BamB
MRALFLIISVLLTLIDANGQTSVDWSGFRGSQDLLGTTNVNFPDNPKKLWTFQTGDNIKSAPVISDGKIVIGATDGIVYCLDLKGKLIWKFKTENSIEASALILNKKVYIGNLDGSFYALNLSNGALLWKYKTDGQIIGAANWYKSGSKTSLIVGSYDYNLHCIDAETGKMRWKYESDNYINGTAACFNGKAIFGGCDGFLHVIDINSGKSESKINVATYVAGSCPVSDKMAYIGDYDGKFSKVDTQTGTIVWSWENAEFKQPFIASAALSGDKIVTGNRDKFVYCFDKNSGKLLWNYNSGNRIEASPVIIRGKVLIANMRGDIALLKLTDMSVIWKYETGNSILQNPAVIENLMVACTLDGVVYCFGK